MGARMLGITRANGRIYIAVQAACPAESKLAAHARTCDGEPLPCALYPVDTDRFAVCIPAVDVPIAVSLTVETPDEHADPVFEKTIRPRRVRWENRIRGHLTRGFASAIQDAERRCSRQELHVIFHNALYGPETFVVQGEVLGTPDDAFTLPNTVTAMSSEGARTNAQVAPLANPRNGTQAVSFILPQPSGSLAFCFDDPSAPTGPFGCRFAMLERHVLDGWLHRYATTCMDKADWSGSYDAWARDRRTSADELARQRAYSVPDAPSFSLVVPLFKTPLPFLNDLIDSVRAQTYPNWELILVNASPEIKELHDAVTQSAARDARIRIVEVGDNGGISRNTNAGIAQATGDFVGFLDHDDMLAPDLLFEYASAVSAHHDIDVLYCDEDKFDKTGRHFSPFFKPDFNLDLLRSHNYICHMLTIRRSLLSTIGSLDPEMDGAQDYDLALRASERARRIHHVPKSLYYWRFWEMSTAASDSAKPYTNGAASRALAAHLDRMGIDATIEDKPFPNMSYVRYAVPRSRPLVSIILPSGGDHSSLERCLRSVDEKTGYADYEVLVVPERPNPEFANRLDRLCSSLPRTRLAVESQASSRLAALNSGARQARGEYLVFLAPEVEIEESRWLETLLANAARAEVGAVGLKLIYPDETIAHAGLTWGPDGVHRLFHGLHLTDWGYWCFAWNRMDVGAVGLDCMMAPADLFARYDGFDEELDPLTAALDYGLYVQGQGLLTVYAAENIELLHRAPWDMQGYTDEKWARLHSHWSEQLAAGDPNFSRALDPDLESTWCYVLPQPSSPQ